LRAIKCTNEGSPVLKFLPGRVDEGGSARIGRQAELPRPAGSPTIPPLIHAAVPPALASVSYDPWVVALSYLIASLAAYVALDLARRVHTPDRVMAMGWWAAGSMTMGTGIWSMHFVGMLALKLPFAVGYDYLVTGASWVAAVAVSAIALHIAGRRQLNGRSLAVGALAMGGGICVMHYTGMAALALDPGIRWDWTLVAASAGIAVAASAVALLIFFWLRRLTEAAARLWQGVAALVMGAAIAGMHYTGMAAAGFAEGTLCLSAGQLRGDNLTLLISAASMLLLTQTLLASLLDARMQSKASTLARSLRAANEELQDLAFRDVLTGLANRLLFDDRAAHAAEVCKREGAGLAVLFVDLDGFKPINDSFGHEAGDEVLRQVARRLEAQARSTDTVARVGGDEFVLLLEGRPDAATAAQVAERIIEALSQPVQVGGRGLRLSGSVGIAMFPMDGPREMLMAHADSAMHAAKRAGGGSYAFFQPHMAADAREQVELQRDLRLALEQGGQLELHYQPKVRAADGCIAGVEALLRWRHPARGLLGPGLFVPVAERFGLIGTLGHWVIDEACRQVAAWRDQGLRLGVAINLSAHQLRQDDLVQRVEQALARHALDPAQLTFEITESAAVEDGEEAMHAFQRLGGLGVHLSIDDFGTGYSSLSYLRRLHAGQLKIDRSFVHDVASSADARAIVQAVVQLAHSLGLSVVAEGVETQAQRDALKALQCDELQGYLFARPLTAQVLAEWALDAQKPAALKFSPSAFVEA
jgi:diguanylate cyclase (GGDEF)-like protein